MKLAIAIVLLATTAVHGQIPSYLRLKGQKQGYIDGAVTSKVRAKSIEVLAWEHAIESPRDAASGLPTGKRRHSALSVYTRPDVHSPKMETALVNNENLSEWKLSLWRPTITATAGVGTESNYYNIKLTNANVASYKYGMFSYIEGKTERKELLEQWRFTYQKIEWEFTTGGITALDDWEAPVVFAEVSAASEQTQQEQAPKEFTGLSGN